MCKPKETFTSHDLELEKYATYFAVSAAISMK